MTSPILVTGGSGWLGQRLLRGLTGKLPDTDSNGRLSADAEIRCLLPVGIDAAPLEEVSERVSIFRGDLRHPEDVEGFCTGAEESVLFHVAGIIHPTLFTRELFAINVQGSRNLLESAERHGVRRVVVVSSNSVAGANPDRTHVFDEQSPPHPYMKYGKSKQQLEELTARVQARGQLETVIARTVWFYGPGQPPRQTEFFEMIRHGKFPIVGGGEARRSLGYVDNVCQGLLLCAESPGIAGETFWIADRRPYSMNEIISTIQGLLANEFGIPVRGRNLRVPNITSELAGAADWLLQSAGTYVKKIHVLSEMNKTIACSIDKATRMLGYDPPVTLEEGMRRSIRWCLDRGLIKT